MSHTLQLRLDAIDRQLEFIDRSKSLTAHAEPFMNRNLLPVNYDWLVRNLKPAALAEFLSTVRICHRDLVLTFQR